jgi:N-acetylglucosamine kinase-like BadF-type ATPase
MTLAVATSGDLSGVVVVSGTGMIVIGVNRSGERQRAGGWGALLDERGSGFAIGSAALKAVANAEDGLGMPTQLTAVVLSYLQLSAPRERERWTYADYNWALRCPCPTGQPLDASRSVSLHSDWE